MPPHLQAEQTKRLLSAEDLARQLGVGRTTAYSLLWSETIPSMKVGRLRKVRREDLEAYIKARMEHGEHGEFEVVYRPRADATREGELSALVAAYRFIIFDCRHVNEKGAQRGAPDAAKESDNGCDAARIVPR